ncbi:fatty acid hydroxylase [Mycena rebaudengoi]|nr:fatty acid hydroxylase [Mycena rebaudengoi]
MSIPIPQPPTIPFIGNVTSLEKEVPLRSFHLLAETYGEIYQLNILGRTVVVVSSYELGNEVSDETRFKRRLTGGMTEVRNLVNDGLFTSYGDPDEPNWGIAHRLLMPVFGPLQIKEMMEEMRDIASQLLLKAHTGYDLVLRHVSSLELLLFGNPPEFVVAMGDFLRESGLRANRPRVLQALMPGTTTKYEQDIKKMKDLAGKIVATRKTHPMPKKDLLDAMLNSRDPQTGQAMTDRSITDNLLTFLIAGHETTSGMMTFMVYYLLKNPEALRKLRTEVDEVLGDRPVQYEDFGKLKYLTAVMRETLRLSAPLPTRPTAPLEDTTLGGGKYAVKAGTIISLLTWKIQTDPHIWGDDKLVDKVGTPGRRIPTERMLDGKFEALPFGYGVRACIGRAFAWQEVLLVMSSLIQKFDLSFVDPSYVMNLKQTLTITSSGMLPLYVLYGSNSGTSEAFAQRVANDAPSYGIPLQLAFRILYSNRVSGFRPSIGTLDSALDKVPTNGPVVIITASFEGEPADNAARFIDWLRHLEGNKLENVRFAVFGCGNSDWNATFQKIPILCDELLEKDGGSRLVPRGAGDARSANFFQTFDDFEANLWATLSKEYSTSRSEAQTLQVKTVDAGKERAVVLRQADSLLGRVVENRVLTKEGPVKRHIEFELPEGAVARAGDYVAILPQNPIRDVRRVLARFSLSNEEEVVLSSAGPTNLPLDKPVKLSELLSGYVELSQPATTRDVGILIAAATTEGTRAYLEQLKASYVDSVLEKRLSVFQILEGHPDIDLSIGAFLQMLPSMRVRQYSISSSPLWNPDHITITISVLDAPSYSGDGTHPFLGVGSNYLASLIPGDRVQMAVRFIQERATQKATGRDVGEMLLFFGCRSPDMDFLYSDSDLAEWEKNGVVDVRPAFSRSPENSEGCKYIQHRVWNDKADVVDAFRKDAVFFVCGGSHAAKGVKETLVEIIKSTQGIDTAEAGEKFEKMTKGRYATDVFD